MIDDFSERMIHIREILSDRGVMSTVAISRLLGANPVQTIQTLTLLEQRQSVRRLTRGSRRHPAEWVLRCDKRFMPMKSLEKFSTDELQGELSRRRDEPRIKAALAAIQQTFNISPAVVLSRGREPKHDEARHALALLLHNCLGMTLKETAHAMDRKDIGTVCNAVNRANDLLDTEAAFGERYREAVKALKESPF